MRKTAMNDFIEINLDFPYSISQSSLNTFHDCPAKYALQKGTDYHVQTDTSHLRLGILMHDVIDKYYKALNGKTPENEDVMIKMIKTLFTNRWRTSGVYELEKKYKTCLKNFINFEIHRLNTWEEYLPSRSEKHFKYVLGQYRFSGIIDFFNEKVGTMIDWKSSVATELHVTNIRQSEIYRRAIPEIKNVLFVNLGSGAIITAPKMPEDWLLKQVDEMREVIESSKYRKKYNKYCTNCPEMWTCEFLDTKLWDDLMW